MKCLIIYDIIPEETKIALVDLTTVEVSELLPAHGVCVNAGEYTDAQHLANAKVGSAFYDKPEYCEEGTAHWCNKFELFDGTDITGAEVFIQTSFHL